MKSLFRVSNARLSEQSGVSLVIVMVLLIATSLLGIAILRSSAMQERMSANLRDRSIAFQAAEAALRFAQEEVLGNPPVATAPGEPESSWDSWFPDEDSCSDAAICPSEQAPATWARLPDSAYDSDRLAAAPEYWIEYLGLGPSVAGGCEDTGPAREINCRNPMYRITARSRAEGRADVVLQTNVVSRLPGAGS